MVLQKKEQAVKLYSFAKLVLLCLLTVKEIGSTLTKGENQCKFTHMWVYGFIVHISMYTEAQEPNIVGTCD